MSAGNTEERIQQASLRLFATKGFAGTGIRDIATEAGVSLASLYHYISNKEDLLVAIVEVGQHRLTAAGELLLQRCPDPVSQLAGLVKLHVWVHGIRQQSALVADTEVRSLTGPRLAEMLSLRDGYQRLWRDVLQAGHDAGVMDLLNPKLTSFALLEMCTGVSHWYSPTGELTLDHVGDVFADAAMGLVRATRDGVPARAAALYLPEPSEVYDAAVAVLETAP